MNAIDLLLPDGQPSGWSLCSSCRQAAAPGNRDLSERCCICVECGKPCCAPGGGSMHDECRRMRYVAHEVALLDKAALVEGYEGPVYCDGRRGSYGDGYFSDVEELAERLDDEPDDARPEFAFCCHEVRPRVVDAGEFVGDIAQDMYDDACGDAEGVEALEAALAAFYAANVNWKSYCQDTGHKVRIRPRRAV
jgi:hypothetical protein